MNEKEVLVRIIDIKNEYPIRAEYTSIPAEILKMYHYMKNKDGLYIHLENSDEENNPKYDNVEATVKEVEVVPGGNEWLNCINVYVEILGEA